MTGLKLLQGERQKGESDKAVIACNDYLRMGPGRKLTKLLAQYQNPTGSIRTFEAPTTTYKTISTWSSRFSWDDRASGYDATWEDRKNQMRQAVFEEGFALDFERAKALKQLATFLLGQMYEQGEGGDYHNLWLPDVKQIGSGDFAERVDIERWNSPIISDLRGVLDDIAKEVGGRSSKSTVTVEDWRSRAIDDIKAGQIDFNALAQAFDESLAAELFRQAGVPVEIE